MSIPTPNGKEELRLHSLLSLKAQLYFLNSQPFLTSNRIRETYTVTLHKCNCYQMITYGCWSSLQSKLYSATRHILINQVSLLENFPNYRKQRTNLNKQVFRCFLTSAYLTKKVYLVHRHVTRFR